jgi:hypothetical protein
VAAASPTDELEALEQARSSLEAALADDESWRALRRPVPDDPRPSAAMARLARNNRLEMALADNELYQAWKHVNVAITALRARNPDGVAGSRDQDGASAAAASAAPVAPGAEAALRTARRLMRRLEAIEAEPPTAVPSPEPESEPAPEKPAGAREAPRRRPEPRVRTPVPEPAEATVTFIMREPALVAPAEPNVGSDGAPIEPPVPAPVANAPASLAPFTEEAEVSIVAGAAEPREAEPPSLVGRLRRALSKD